MKTFNQFMTEAYSASDELNEVVGAAARFIPGVKQAYGLYSGTSSLLRGDKTGAALGYASMLPGPLGWGAAAADLARNFSGGNQPQAAKPEEKKPEEKKPTTTTKSPVLSKKDGVEGTGVGKDFVAKKWSDAERQRYQSKRGEDQLKKDAVETARRAAGKGYAGQQPKSLDLKKPVKIDQTNFANIKAPKFVLPKISA